MYFKLVKWFQKLNESGVTISFVARLAGNLDER